MKQILRAGAAAGGPEAGQTMAEYAVVLAVITSAIVVSIALLSTTTNQLIAHVISFL